MSAETLMTNTGTTVAQNQAVAPTVPTQQPAGAAPSLTHWNMAEAPFPRDLNTGGQSLNYFKPGTKVSVDFNR